MGLGFWRRWLKLARGSPPATQPLRPIDCAAMDSDFVKRLMWSGLLTGTSALFSMLAHRTAAQVWRRLFDEEHHQAVFEDNARSLFKL